MRLEVHKHTEVEQQNVQNFDFSVTVSNKLFHILSSPYKYTAQAVLRELLTNAKDATITTGVMTPIKLTLPTTDFPFVIIEDYGTGMSFEMTSTKMTSYGYSSKESGEHADVTNGVLGIGCKAPLAICNSYNVTSFWNGEEYAFTFYKGEDGTPKAAHLFTRPTERANGVQVKVPVKPSDIDTFTSCAHKVLSALDYPVEIEYIKNVSNGDEKTQRVYRVDSKDVVELQQWLVPTNKKIINMGSGFITSYPSALHAKCLTVKYSDQIQISANNIHFNDSKKIAYYAHSGGVMYPIDIEALEMAGKKLGKYKGMINVIQQIVTYSNVIVCFPFDIGQVMFAPSREELDYSIKSTRDNVYEKLIQMIDYIIAKFDVVINAQSDKTPLFVIYRDIQKIAYNLLCEMNSSIAYSIITDNIRTFSSTFIMSIEQFLIESGKIKTELPKKQYINVGWMYNPVEVNIPDGKGGHQPIIKYERAVTVADVRLNGDVFGKVDENNASKSIFMRIQSHRNFDIIGSFMKTTRLLSEIEYNVIKNDGISVPIGYYTSDIAVIVVSKKVHSRIKCANALAKAYPNVNRFIILSGDQKQLSSDNVKKFVDSIGSVVCVYTTSEIIDKYSLVQNDTKVVKNEWMFSQKSAFIVNPNNNHIINDNYDLYNKNDTTKPIGRNEIGQITISDIISNPYTTAVVISSSSNLWASVKKNDNGATVPDVPLSSEGIAYNLSELDMILKPGIKVRNAYPINNARNPVAKSMDHLGITAIARITISDYDRIVKTTGRAPYTIMDFIVQKFVVDANIDDLYVTCKMMQLNMDDDTVKQAIAGVVYANGNKVSYQYYRSFVRMLIMAEYIAFNDDDKNGIEKFISEAFKNNFDDPGLMEFMKHIRMFNNMRDHLKKDSDNCSAVDGAIQTFVNVCNAVIRVIEPQLSKKQKAKNDVTVKNITDFIVTLVTKSAKYDIVNYMLNSFEFTRFFDSINIAERAMSMKVGNAALTRLRIVKQLMSVVLGE